MKDQAKTKEQFINELVDLRQRVAEVEESKVAHKQAEDELRMKVRVMAQTEEILNAERFMLQQCLENLPLFAYNISFDGKIAGVNNRAVKGLGYANKDELIGKPLISTIYAPGSRKKVKQFLKKWKHAGKLKNEELQVITKQGKVIDVLLSVDTIFDQNGKPMHILSTQLDITESKHAEEVLKQHTHDLGERIKELNCLYGVSNLADKQGITLEEILQGTLDLIPSSWQYPEITCARVILNAQVFTTDNFEETEWKQASDIRENSRRVGSLEVYYLEERPESDEGPFLNEERSLINAVAQRLGKYVERRQTDQARLESEERFKAMSTSAQDAIIMIDPEGRILFWNDAAEKIFGWSAKEAVGKNLHALLAPVKYHEAYQKGFKKFQQTGEGAAIGKVLELSALRKGGPEFPVEYSVARVKLRGSWQAIGIVRDITGRKQAEEELKKSREELKNLAAHLQSAREEERTSIAREIHDELGQALTALKMDLFWLRKRLPEDQRPYLEKIQSMVDLTDRTIVTIKRISTDLRPSMLDDLGLIAAIEWQAEDFQNRTGIKCDAALDFEEIELDEDRRTAIFRIFQETLTNIARHADATRARIYLRKRAKSLELEVRDNGKGITEEEISDSKAHGLIGIRERVQFIGGKVTISGAPNKGTKVLVKIPLPDIGAVG